MTADPSMARLELTRQQLDIVNHRPDGDLLVKGIPGSGKTLTVVARAAKLGSMPLLTAEPGVPLVRIFSFNKMLSEWIGFLAAQLDEEPPEVTTFHGWAYQAIRAMGNHNAYEFENYAAVLAEEIKKAEGLPAHYRAHHVLVDEAQDLQPAELQLIKLSAITSFTVAADKAQNIYKTGFSFKSIGINVQGRTKSLGTNLRGTRQIAQLAADLSRHDPALEKEDVAADLSTLRDGPLPEIFHCGSFEAEDNVVRETIRLARSENPNATIAVLHAHKRAVFGISKAIGGRLLDRQHPDMTSPGVIVSTIHNVKGLEFDTVIVKGVNAGILPRDAGVGETQAEEDEVGRRLLYVAVTRAKRRLVLICGAAPSPYVREFNPAHYRSA